MAQFSNQKYDLEERTAKFGEEIIMLCKLKIIVPFLLFPLTVSAFTYSRTPGGTNPLGPISFQSEQLFDEDIVGCGDKRYQLVVFSAEGGSASGGEGENQHYGDPGYYFPVRSDATQKGFSINEAGDLEGGKTYRTVAVFTFLPEDGNVPNCDINNLEIGEFAPLGARLAESESAATTTSRDLPLTMEEREVKIEELKIQILKLQIELLKLQIQQILESTR